MGFLLLLLLQLFFLIHGLWYDFAIAEWFYAAQKVKLQQRENISQSHFQLVTGLMIWEKRG